MKGAVFYSGQYGSTAQYAYWIGAATGLPVFDVNNTKSKPSQFDFLILGSSVIIYKLTIRKWVKRHLPTLLNKPVILFSTSGAPSGPKLDGWIHNCLPEELVTRMEHVALRGRLDPKTVSWWHRVLLKIGAWNNKDPQARKEELEGFDYMDKAGIEPILNWVQKLKATRHQLVK